MRDLNPDNCRTHRSSSAVAAGIIGKAVRTLIFILEAVLIGAILIRTRVTRPLIIMVPG
jgi:hypothetical protein